MIATLIKILFFYFLYLMLKNAIKGFLTYKQLKNQAAAYAAQNGQKPQNSRPAGCDKGVYEAEYRVVSEKD